PPRKPQREIDLLPKPSRPLAAPSPARERRKTLSLYKRGAVYWSYVWMDGIRYAQSTGTGNRRKAELIDQRFKEELNLKGHHVTDPDPNLPFGELAAQFLAEGDAKGWHRDRLGMLLPYWADIPIGRIHKGIALDYRKHRHAEREREKKKQITETTVN